VYKIGNSNNISNFRSISVLNIIFKNLRKGLIFKPLSTHTHNILANGQYGFRHNSLTENASYKVTDDILLALNNK